MRVEADLGAGGSALATAAAWRARPRLKGEAADRGGHGFRLRHSGQLVGRNYDIGKGMADQVVDELVNDGSFRVIERKKLDTVLAEQDFAQSDRADPSAAKLAKVGKVLGVKYIIAGSITKFATRTRSTAAAAACGGRSAARGSRRPRARSR